MPDPKRRRGDIELPLPPGEHPDPRLRSARPTKPFPPRKRRGKAGRGKTLG